MSNWQKLEIKHETPNIPAPFSFETKVDLQMEKEGLSVNFRLTYTDRDDLEEEEILDEGFTGNDDIEWHGHLPAQWLGSLKLLLEKTTWTRKFNPHSQSNITVFLDGISQGHPSNADKWEFWLQELQQACMEAGKIEKPLEVDFQKGDKKIGIKASFFSRHATIHDYSEGASASKDLDWSAMRRILKHIYLAEFLPDDVMKQPDTKGDAFLHLGGGQWFNLETSNLQLLKKQEWLVKLENLLTAELSDPSA